MPASTVYEGRKFNQIADLAEIDAIVPTIFCRLRDDQLRRNHLLTNELPDLANRVVLFVRTDVEDLVAHGGQRCLHYGHDRPRRILDMNERSPLIAVVHRDLAIDLGLGGEQVNHQIEAGATGQSVDRGEPQDRGRETGIRQVL